MTTDTYEFEVPGGAHWSLRIRRGMQMTLTDVQGGANAAMLFYNPENLLERYNAPDTLKGQHTFKLTKGHCLYSDMGRVFVSIIEDSFGWHETVCGNLHASHVKERWGGRSYQEAHNDWTLNGYDSFLTEIAKYGLTRRDMAANVNFFSRVEVDDKGQFILTKAGEKGTQVTLRFEMDTLAVLHTCPHPLNMAEDYPRAPVHVKLEKAAPVTEDDVCLNSYPENARAFENNRLYYLGA